ncbi:MAG: HEAT repeat domain-containing protein, partial [Burkholderiales bacterium]
LDALGAMPEITRALLPSLLSDADADVRLLSCELVRQLDASEAVDLLGPVLEQEMHPNVCGAAVDVLAELGDSLCVEPLRTCAARFASDPYLSFAIADAISRTSTRSASNG